MSAIDTAEFEGTARAGGSLRIVTGLLGNRQRLMVVLMTLGKIVVGFCDLAVAAAMYLLFLLLQGRSAPHHPWWTPTTVLSAAVITVALVALRGLTDLISSRSTFRQIQNLHAALLLRLTDGYSQIQWGRFVESNRSELSGRALQTTREAADFYHRCVEMTANGSIVAVMTAALIYQSLRAACVLGLAVAAFYGVHRFLIRRKLQVAASSREISDHVSCERNLAGTCSPPERKFALTETSHSFRTAFAGKRRRGSRSTCAFCVSSPIRADRSRSRCGTAISRYCHRGSIAAGGCTPTAVAAGGSTSCSRGV